VTGTVLALEGLRKRKGNLTVSNDHKNASKMIGFEIEPGEEVETDRSLPSGFQKVARFTDNGCQLVTAGADGHFRVWKVCLAFETFSVLEIPYVFFYFFLLFRSFTVDGIYCEVGEINVNIICI